MSRLKRRDWLRIAAAGAGGLSCSGWLEALAADAAANPQRKRACILLWMNGGPSQMDTFDLKPGHANGGSYQAIDTAAPGVRISEHLPQVAKHMKRLAIVRSMSTPEGDHGRAAYLMRTGNRPQAPIQFPSLGAIVSKETGRSDSELPNYVSIAPTRFSEQDADSAGYLGAAHTPLLVGENADQGVTNRYEDSLKVDDLQSPAEIGPVRTASRARLLKDLDQRFAKAHPGEATHSRATAYERAFRLMRSPAVRAFNLEEEKAAVREHYGRNIFGQGCLLARRLVERGVPFVEVSLGGVAEVGNWDTHQHNFDTIKTLSGQLDPAWGSLMADLDERGLLDSTLIVWMGEFGRTPRINGQVGRDHFPRAWSVVLGGGGIKGGQVVGKTSASGGSVEERPVSVPDLMATLCQALGIDHLKKNMSNIGRPIRIVEKDAKPLTEVLA
ncbi:MAG: DUF1501 domain-containing protein [Gemmataceae bacterium]